ncbi:Nucleotide-diphospho-sugar transferases protein [Dioscorea alata]|uniref:Nucleotide-diphospho-sugar transferases protein n=2 Tax=Dioscorea alata TaxID=55571 RepID=A0ACB7U0R2_DIOAL|nr:Nucleotide-diphospho-sugar transferases protein [Dioscorea alata]KAH7653887.1 Nucleotide-diphospho-sugar transferases protein [Dioscorea alata]
MPAELENSSVMTASNSASGEASVSSSGQQAPVAPVKKKRNLPGMPDPDAEVIALSPKTLMATNRFVCEICNKGFQRDQNLQLHRRGHNLPWKLRQRTGKEAKKRVYVCPEPTCVHHEPSRALGDLTGIKKHYCRKHGEKKWKCDKCSKKYAVQSDWKAHSKTCGTREYRCDCGTLFSRRDSFITHRAFCDALTVEGAKMQAHAPAAAPTAMAAENEAVNAAPAPSCSSPAASPEPQQQQQQQKPEPPPEVKSSSTTTTNAVPVVLQCIPQAAAAAPPAPTVTINSTNSSSNSVSTSLFASLWTSPSTTTASTVVPATAPTTAQSASFSDLIGAMSRQDRGVILDTPSLCLSSNGSASIFSQPPERRQYAPAPTSPHLSATALLQKAAQMGAAATNASLLRGFGLSTSTSPSHQETSAPDTSLQWRHHQQIEPEPPMLSAGLRLGLTYDNNATRLPELMMGSSSLFTAKPATMDFLGLGMGHGGSATSGLSALITSIGSGLDMSVGPAAPWDGADGKPSSPAIL